MAAWQRSRLIRGGLLLEVVVAMTVLVTAMGLMGAQLCNSLRMTSYAEEQMRATQIAEYILALIEFDPETQKYLAGETEEIEYEFGEEDPEYFWRLKERFPAYFWRVYIEPVDPNDIERKLNLITIEILFQRDPEDWDTIDGAKLVRRVSLLKAKPVEVDLQELGINPDNLDQLEGLGLPPDILDQIPTILESLGGFESGAVPLQQLIASFDSEMLATLMPTIQSLLTQAGGNGMPNFPGFGGIDGQNLQGIVDQFGDTLRGGAGPAGLGATQGGGRRGGGQGGGGRRGGGQPGSSSEADQAIQRLLEMRDQLRAEGGGR